MEESKAGSKRRAGRHQIGGARGTGSRAREHQLQGQVLAGDDGEAAELADAQVDERPAEDAAVDVLDEDQLEERVHLAEVFAHLVGHGPVDGV